MKKRKGSKNPEENIVSFDVLSSNLAADIMYNYVDYVPTKSALSLTIRKKINKLLDEKPEYSYVIYSLLTYSTHKWASDMRKKMGLSEDSYNELYAMADNLIHREREIFERSGIRPMLHSNDRFELLSCSDDILDSIENAVEDLKSFPKIGEKLYRVIKAVHFAPPGVRVYSDVRADFFNKYYETAIEIIYRRSGDIILSRFSSLVSMQLLIKPSVDHPYSDAYHNTKKLMEIYATLDYLFARTDLDTAGDMKKQRDVDGQYLLSILDNSIELLKSYPIDEGKDSYYIIRMLLEQKEPKEIWKRIGCSERDYYRKKPRAINLLSFILWGYSTTQILNGIICKPNIGEGDVPADKESAGQIAKYRNRSIAEKFNDDANHK